MHLITNPDTVLCHSYTLQLLSEITGLDWADQVDWIKMEEMKTIR
jgi:hypothetical protein